MPRLREQIAGDSPGTVGVDDVLVTAGAAPALFIVATALLEAGDHILIAEPNYATNLETPRTLGAEVDTVPMRFEDGWELDLDLVESKLRPETKLISVTYPHNPTGAMIDAATLGRLVEIVEAHPSAHLLVDETYRELAFGDPLPVAAGLSRRAISVSSMSKTYGLPGLRMGWLICRDPELEESLLAAKEQILICGSPINEEMAARVLEARDRVLPPIKATIASHLAIVNEWMDAQEVFEWVEPRAGVVGMPRFRDPAAVDLDGFYDDLLNRHGTYVGPGHWFDQERSCFRLGFGWPETEELRRGLDGLMAAAAANATTG